MKMNIEIDMTPDEARRFMGLPDVSKAQERLVADIEKRMKAAIDINDPEAMMRAWMPLGGQGFEQFQRFMFDAAKRAAGGPSNRSDKTKA
jgi:hypothetical protein